MLQNSSRAPESKILSLRGSASGRHDRPSDEALKFRNRWPFTVAASYDALAPEHMQHAQDLRLHGQKDNASFVT